MEGSNARKLHPIIEILIIAAIMLGCDLLLSYGCTLYANGESYQKISSIYTVLSWLELLAYPMLATFLCFKIIEGRRFATLKLLAVALCVSIPFLLVNTICINLITPYGDQAVFSYLYVILFLYPTVKAILITLFVNILDAPMVRAYVYDRQIHCDLLKHILLMFLTFGIWPLVWIYRVTVYLNCVEEEENRSPAAKLLLCMFVPFYSIYWTYKSAQRIDKLAQTVNVVSDLTTPCLILEFFVPVIPPILMQDKINKIIETDNIQ